MSLTHILLLVISIILLVYDPIAYKIGQPMESIVIRDLGYTANVIPFALGILIGHWYFNHKITILSGWMYTLPALLLIGIYDLLVGIGALNVSLWLRYPGFFVLLGIPFGSILWSQGSTQSPF